ncbi:MAG: FAD-dependent oxidoreductase [Burkholderiales bacterium]|nr:FAD-dependent oxidoreductase [Burkholderiales bacterium]
MADSRIAVVGSGIAGLSAAWLLARRYSVTVFEANDYLGGHTNTVDVTLDGVTHPVDTGFLVFNDRTYPNLVALFRHIGVRDAASDMSFSVRLDDEGIEWAGSSIATVFAQKRNLVRPEFWSMLGDIVRFNREASKLAQGALDPSYTVARFLDERRYGRPFRDWYLLPMAAAIWSCPTEQMLAYPAQTLFRFCQNHGLLQIANRPQWRTVVGGGREYVRRLAAHIDDVRLATPVTRVRRRDAFAEVETESCGVERFDHVVLACHSDQSLELLADASAAESELLGSIRYESNLALLHTDASLLPRSRDAWSAWNYHAGRGNPAKRPVSVSYLINKLQPLPFTTPVVVTLNPTAAPRPESVLARFDYAHPAFDGPAIEAQRKLQGIQGRRRTWFCGAWTGYGFHEDGLKAGLAVANALGCFAPWQAQEAAA